LQPKQTYFSTKAIYACCQAHQLLLFMDDARLGSALNAQDNGKTLPNTPMFSTLGRPKMAAY